jgi:hypothetical protein
MPTAMTPTLSKECYFGIVPQSSNDQIQGSYEGMGASTLYPLTSPESVEKQLNIDYFRMADYQDYALQPLVRSQGEWWEGDVELALIPGATANLITLIQTRATYNQGYFCSCYFHMTHWYRRLWDVKIARARFRWTTGDICRCTLSLIAMDGDGTVDGGGTFPADALPYQWKETALQLETAGGGLAADVNVEEVDLTLDNFVHDAAEGLRIVESNKPQRLYNTSGIACEGSFTRDAVDANVWADFLALTPADMTLTMSRGGNNMSFTIRNMVYNSASAPIPGDNVSRIALTTPFTATSADGSTPPITLA